VIPRNPSVRRHPLDTDEPHYPNRAERLADTVIHGLGLTGALAGGAILLLWSLQAGDVGRALAAGIYAACLVAMLLASTVYNLSHPCAVRPWLRRLDEAAIFLLIAGSYTPFTTQLAAPWNVGLTALVWTIALVGVAGRLFIWSLSERFWCGVYVAMGWLAVVALKPLIDGIPVVALGLLALGGILYTAGVPLFLHTRLPYRRAIWHGLVVAGAASHYAAVAHALTVSS
jgi:hemolysin III